MKKTYSVLAAIVVLSTFGETILSPSDVRVWQTVFEPSTPLTWRWETAAASARLTVSNLLDKAAPSVSMVARASAAVEGSYAINYAAGAVSCGEALYDVVLEQLDGGEAVLDTQTARLAYLPVTFDVQVERRLGRIESPRLVAYDAGWTNVTEDASSASFSFTPAMGVAVVERLPEVSGHFAVGDVAGRLAVDFDGLPTVWASDIVPKQGAILIVY